jgi:hypothetical protein
MSRAGLREKARPGAKAVETPYDQAGPGLQEHLRTYGTPLVTRSLDAHGHETGRTILVESRTAPVQVGLADTILSVHAPFPDDLDRWEAPGRIAMGLGRSAEGTLRFEKVEKPGPDGTVRVAVSGTLKVEGVLGPGKVKNGVYTVKGEQTFDLPTKGWRSARWTVDVALDVTTLDDQPGGHAVGSLVLTMGGPGDLLKIPSDASRAKEKARGDALQKARAGAKEKPKTGAAAKPKP